MQRVEFETLKTEVTKAPTLTNPFDVMKPFEKSKKNNNIELTFTEGKEKLYNVGKIKKDDGQEVKRVISPNESTDPVSRKKYLPKSTQQLQQQIVDMPLPKEKITREKLKRSTKPYFSDGGGSEAGSSSVPTFVDPTSDNKISLPKLNKLKQSIKETNNVNKELSEEKEPKETSNIAMFNFDDSYAQVSKLKPKIDTTEKFQTKKTNSVTQGDVKLSFLKNGDEQTKVETQPNMGTRKSENQSTNSYLYQSAAQVPTVPTVKINNFGGMGVKDAEGVVRQDTFVSKVKENSVQAQPQPQVAAKYNHFGMSSAKNVEAPTRQDTFLPKSKTNVAPSQKRTINWDAGDFDPRECFVMWSYEPPPPPIVVDKKFADSLKRYAELMAKLVLGKGL